MTVVPSPHATTSLIQQFHKCYIVFDIMSIEARNRALLVLLLVVLSLLLTFGVRTWLHLRDTGSTGFRGISGRPGSLPWIGGVSFALALACTVLAPLLVWLGVDRWLFLPQAALDIVGTIAALLGVAGIAWSQNAMGRSWRVGVDGAERTTLVLEGPFRAVRNPVFSFLVLGSLGLLLVLPTFTSLAALALLVLAIELQVRIIEEPYLRTTHGDTYTDYSRRTGRFVPWIGRD
ncbi:methyltransferase family protein [Chondromyces crocatus]|uniref:Isoprenylcysteine carboxyl methyltransferase n=1 Tax=Chondromyces crocatus TaxID=52 RepID=A0A0K1EL59_CHOCO|nr:isoprenylcysteine carboxylmethyltransferase family protein [Chondromyces crocatus]AKT41605.1 isoprenylcysteine carboxyl methyltransferase [Chondromyces crocatus]